MTTTTVEELPTATCTSCDAPVQIRRPSLTGHHYCGKLACQRAKQRFYYRQRQEGLGFKARAELERQAKMLRDTQIVEFVDALSRAERAECPTCGRTDALPGYVHPNLEDPVGPCFEMRSTALPEDLGNRLVRAAWPDAAWPSA